MSTVFTVILAAIAIALAILLWTLRQSDLLTGTGTRALAIEQLDVEAFRRILDDRDEDYIRQYLGTGDFRRARRMRIHAAIDYTLRARRNAAAMLKIAQQRLQSVEDRAVAYESRQLLDAAIALRHATFVALLRFHVALVFCSMSLRRESLLQSCCELHRNAAAAKASL